VIHGWRKLVVPYMQPQITALCDLTLQYLP